MFIRGEVTRVYGSRISARYGIESYFVDPERAMELEKEARRGKLFMKVVVDDQGRGIIRGVAKIQRTPFGLESAQLRSRDARRIADIKQFQLALKLYFGDNSMYPETLELLSPNFIPALHGDPLGQPYHYAICSPTSYHLGADLEDRTNIALSSDDDIVSLCPEDPIRGTDRSSCSGEVASRFCFDVTEGGISGSGGPVPAEIPPPQPPQRAPQRP